VKFTSTINSTINCSDLYDKAAESLKKLDNDIDETIQDLAQKVEARGVPKNKVARQVLKELTAREVLSPSRIYEGLGVEQKRKYKKRKIEETFPQAENISAEESSTNQQAVQVTATRRGQSEILKNMNVGPDIKLVSEEQKRIGASKQENESLKDNDRLEEKEGSESVKEKEMAHLREENRRLKSEKEELQRQLAEKTEQISELRKDNEGLQKVGELELLRAIQDRFYAGPGLLKETELEKISEKAGRDIEKTLQHYNTVLGDVAELGLPIPLGTYIITKPDMVLVPVRIMINFDKMEVELSLWKKKLQIPSPSTSVSSNASKAASN
jgi:chromosome segregation ATPase